MGSQTGREILNFLGMEKWWEKNSGRVNSEERAINKLIKWNSFNTKLRKLATETFAKKGVSLSHSFPPTA